MAYRKYDTCFYERYAATALQNLLGHKFDGLLNLDRPDLQSPDGHRLGIEVTRAMEGGKPAARVLLKEMAGIRQADSDERLDLDRNYWSMARPLCEILRSKVAKVADGFYGEFDEFGLFVFCQETLDEAAALKAITYIRDLQRDNEKAYARLFLCDLNALYAGNLEDDISFEYRLGVFPMTQEQRKDFYIDALFQDRTERQKHQI